MTTNQWLHTEEKMANSNYNGTGDREYLSKYTVSGLWTLCYTNPGEKDLQCSNIDYFPREEYSPDPNDSTMAIPYAVTKSAVFFILATLFLCLGEFCCLFGHFARQRRLFTFISGVVFIISGLLMLIGLVMYISIFKAEIGNKLRPRSQLQPPLFTYRYGFSFLLVVSGFMASETAGTCAIFLYIYWHQKEWMRKRHELHLHRRKLSSSSMLLAAAEAAAAAPPPHPHPPPGIFPCRRHPHPYYAGGGGGGRAPPPPGHHRLPPARACAAVGGGISPTLHQRRFYLDRAAGDDDSQEVSPCLSRSHQNLPASVSSCVEGSMRDIGVSASFYSFPAAAASASGYHHYYHHHGEEECGAPPPLDLHGRPPPRSGSRASFFPRDVTTNTVSTTADINSCEGGDAAEGPDDDEDEYSPSIQHEHEFVTFDLDEPRVPPAPPARASAAAAAAAHAADEQRRKEFSLETLRRTTPV
ncbi:hypothetical protein R5R35_005472 [Gryllus longicercus]